MTASKARSTKGLLEISHEVTVSSGNISPHSVTDGFDFAQLHSELAFIKRSSAVNKGDTSGSNLPTTHRKLPERTLDWTDLITPDYDDHMGGGGSGEV